MEGAAAARARGQSYTAAAARRPNGGCSSYKSKGTIIHRSCCPETQWRVQQLQNQGANHTLQLLHRDPMEGAAAAKPRGQSYTAAAAQRPNGGCSSCKTRGQSYTAAASRRPNGGCSSCKTRGQSYTAAASRRPNGGCSSRQRGRSSTTAAKEPKFWARVIDSDQLSFCKVRAMPTIW